MRSSTDALYDACSLAALGRSLLECEVPASLLRGVWGVEECLSPAWMRPETAARLRGKIRLCDLPTPSELKRILARAKLATVVAGIDTLIYAAAVHQRRRVVTSDKALAAALGKAKLQVLDSGVMLEWLVRSSRRAVAT